MILAISTILPFIGQAANIIGVVLAKPVFHQNRQEEHIPVCHGQCCNPECHLLPAGQDGHYNDSGIPVLISINAGIIFPLVWSMYADTADYSEWKNGRRATGLGVLRCIHVAKIRSFNRDCDGGVGFWHYMATRPTSNKLKRHKMVSA